MSGPVQGVGYGGLDPRERRGAGQVSDAAIGDGLEKVDGRVRLKLDPKSALSITPRGELSVEQAEQGAPGGSSGATFFRDVLQSGVETTGATLEDVIDAEVELLKRKSQASGYPSLDATVHVPGAELGTSYGAGGTKVLTDTNPPSWNTAPPSSLPLHASTHQHGGTDEVATTTPGADDIPKALGTGKLSAGWVSEVLALVDLTDVAAVTGTGTTAVLSGAPVFTGAPTIPDFTNAQHDHSSAAEGGVLAAAPPGLHATTHQHGGTDEVANSTPGANEIVKALGSGKIASGWVSEILALTDLTDVTTVTGTGSTAVLNGSPVLLTPTIADFTNATHDHSSTAEGGTLAAMAPAAHAASHQHGGSDEVATSTPGANVIVKANASSKIAAGFLTETLALADLTDVTATTGSGSTVPFATSPTLTTPVIGDFTTAQHNHTNAAGGAQIPTAGIADDAVTYAKIQNVTDARVLGRAAGSAGDVQELSAGTGVTIAGGTISATGSGGTVTNVTGTAPISVATGTTTPVVSLDNDGVTFAKMQNIATDRLIGRDTAATGDPEEISLGVSLEFSGSASIQRAALTGDVTAAANGNATTIANDAVTYAKIQNVTTARVLGRTTAGSGDVEELSAGAGITIAAGTISASGGAGTVTNVTGTAPISVATGTTTPVVSLDDNGVSNAKLRDSTALTVIGRSANSTGDPADIAAGTDGFVLRRSGTTLDFGTVATAGIANDAVTDAKLRNCAALSVIGRSANSTGDPADISAVATSGYFLQEFAGTVAFGPPPPGSFIGVTPLVTSGTYTPGATVSAIDVELYGAGGGGGGAAQAAVSAAAGAGGGGGGYNRQRYTGITGLPLDYTVGAGGAGGAAGNSAGAVGGDTTFDDTAVVAQSTATGGGGGAGMAAATTGGFSLGGAGGSAGGGLLTETRGAGSPGIQGIRLTGAIASSGNGGSSQYGGGALGRTTEGAGNDAGGILQWGGGGGGGLCLGTTARAGGYGASGFILVYEYT